MHDELRRAVLGDARAGDHLPAVFHNEVGVAHALVVKPLHESFGEGRDAVSRFGGFEQGSYAVAGQVGA